MSQVSAKAYCQRAHHKAFVRVSGALNARRLANDEIDRDIGEHDAIGRHAQVEAIERSDDLKRFRR